MPNKVQGSDGPTVAPEPWTEATTNADDKPDHPDEDPRGTRTIDEKGDERHRGDRDLGDAQGKLRGSRGTREQRRWARFDQDQGDGGGPPAMASEFTTTPTTHEKRRGQARMRIPARNARSG
jgi:hypothetical protein